MSIQIIEIVYPLNDKSNFKSRVISYSDFGSYAEDLKRSTSGTRIFKTHKDRVDMYITKDNETMVHNAWLVTES